MSIGFCDPDVDDDVFTHASASVDEKLWCRPVVSRVRSYASSIQRAAALFVVVFIAKFQQHEALIEERVPMFS